METVEYLQNMTSLAILVGYSINKSIVLVVNSHYESRDSKTAKTVLILSDYTNKSPYY